jgi:AraC-like DNA-binding protein
MLPSRTAVSVVTRVSPMQVRALLEGLEHVGMSAAAFSARVGLDERQLADPLGWFSVDELDGLTTAAARLSGDVAFGLHWGERAPMVQFDQLPILMATAPTLRVVIDSLLRFQPVLASRDEFRFSERRDRCVLTCDILAASQQGRRMRSEAVLVALLRMLHYFGEGASLRRVNVRHARPEYGAEYERLFGSVVYFDQPFTSIEFSRAALDRTHRNRDVELHQTLQKRFEQLRRRALGELRYLDQVENLIRGSLPKALRQQDAARVLNVSERSLRRRLLQEGVTYGQLVERVRCSVVEDLLSLGDKSTKQMADALGYTGVSGFNRAIRRWTGDSPARLRALRARGH